MLQVAEEGPGEFLSSLLVQKIPSESRVFIFGASGARQRAAMGLFGGCYRTTRGLAHVTCHALHIANITWLFFDAIQPSQPQLQTRVQHQENGLKKLRLDKVLNYLKYP